MAKALLLFIHGLRVTGWKGSSGEATWDKFPALVHADTELGTKFDTAFFDWDSAAIGPSDDPSVVAEALSTEIDVRYGDYDEVVLVAHSLGGLVARRCVGNQVASLTLNPRIKRMALFATPNTGSLAAVTGEKLISGFKAIASAAVGLAGLLPGTSQNLEAVKIDSRFVIDLNTAWGAHRVEDKVHVKYVVVGDDDYVGQTSAWGPSWNPDYAVILGATHIDVVKPADAHDIRFLTLKQFLLAERVEPDDPYNPQPVVDLRQQDVNPESRYVFGARLLPFLGRDNEMALLRSFINEPADFLWTLISGPGGMGKSRLGMELCLEIGSDWRRGFFKREHLEAWRTRWDTWQPAKPTLLLIDYAAASPDLVQSLLHSLSARGAPQGTAPLKQQVRVLLIERQRTGDWLEKIISGGSDTLHVKRSRRYEQALDLGKPADPWLIVKHIFKDKSKALPNEADTRAALEKIDPLGRPLFAMFAADALADDGDIRDWNKERLLDDVLKRQREKIWRPRGATDADERLLALATACGGLTVEQAQSLGKEHADFFPVWKPGASGHQAVMAEMAGRPDFEGVAPLEPDIVGEFFVLDLLERKLRSDQERRLLIDSSWRNQALGSAQFAVRAHEDFTDHRYRLAFILPAPSELTANDREWWATAALKLVIDLSDSDLPAARKLHDEMRGYVNTLGGTVLREMWARGAFFIVVRLRTSDLPAAQQLHEEMRTYADAHCEAVMQREWAAASVIIVAALCKVSLENATALHGRMLKAAREYNSAEILQSWAIASTAVAQAMLSNNPDRAKQMLREVMQLNLFSPDDEIGHGIRSIYEAAVAAAGRRQFAR